MSAVSGSLTGKTVLVASAGCRTGLNLVRCLSRAGAIVIAMDRDEKSHFPLVELNSQMIDTLRFDALQPNQCRTLGRIWGNTPIDLLVHLQALRDPHRLGAVIASIPTLTRALRQGLAAGRGRVLIIHEALPRNASAEVQAYHAALERLGDFMQAEHGRDVTVNTHMLDRRVAQASQAVAQSQITKRTKTKTAS